jgi:hypothetical protein
MVMIGYIKMINLQLQNKLKELKSQALVFDLETSAFWADSGKEINLQTSYDEYVEHAEIKWFGCYSFKNNQSYLLEVSKNLPLIKQLLNDHKILVGFNNDEFDYPILKNNGLLNPDIWYTNVDCMQILGRSNFENKKGFKLKDRATLMGYRLKNNKLLHMAEVFGLEHQKGDIDYRIFQKSEWTTEEIAEIKSIYFVMSWQQRDYLMFFGIIGCHSQK